MPEAIGYTRLSQESDTSIDRQKRHIREYCDDHDLELARIYDDGEMASGFDAEREQYQQVRRRIADGDAAALVLNDKRRIARDIDEVMRLIPDLRTNGIELHTYQDGKLDLSDPMRAAIEILMAAAAHEEKMEEIQKSIRAVEEKLERGDDFGRPRYGMTYDERGVEQVPGDDFEDVVAVLDLRCEGYTFEEIERETGVPSSTAQLIVEREEWYIERDDGRLATARAVADGGGNDA